MSVSMNTKCVRSVGRISMKLYTVDIMTGPWLRLRNFRELLTCGLNLSGSDIRRKKTEVLELMSGTCIQIHSQYLPAHIHSAVQNCLSFFVNLSKTSCLFELSNRIA